MRKAWKYTLAAVGIPLLCFGGLALDSYFRAVSAIAAQDARLEADMAAARMGHPPKAKHAHSFEEGHSGRDSLRHKLIDSTVLDPLRTWSAPLILQQLQAAEDHFREAGYRGATRRSSFEEWELRRLQRSLAARTLTPDQLRDLSESFDRLRSTSPSAADILTAEHLRDRAEVLGVLHLKRDPYGMIRRPPGWREFFSWRILIAKALLELDDHYRQILPLVLLPGRKGERAEQPEQEEALARTNLRSGARDVLRIERERAAEWQFTRMAMALDSFRAEQGRNPQELADLVPDYLRSIPVSPFDGLPYKYENGTLFDMGRMAWWPSAEK